MSGAWRIVGAALIRRQVSLPPMPGHQKVEQDAVHGLESEQLEGLFAGMREDDVVALFPQHRRELLQVRRAVVDGEDPLRPEKARDARVVLLLARASKDGRKTSENDSRLLVLSDEGIRPGVQRLKLHALLLRRRQKKARDAAEHGIEADAPDHRTPLRSGRMPSTTMAVGRESAATRSPSSPVSASRTRYPADVSALRSSSR